MKTILVLEDEPLVMKLLLHVLGRYHVISAMTAEQAIQVFANRDYHVDLLATDVRLSTLSGIRVALLFRSEVPLLPVLLMSGYFADGWRDVDAFDLERLGSESVVLLQKPFETKVLLNAVCELLGESLTATARTASP
jgi:CheY-like chemotaxis protein